MPTLKEVRTRIASVKSTQKITRAMKLVAAARLRRAQDAIVAARPYAQSLAEAVSEVAARAGHGDVHPMLEQRDGRRLTLVVLTSDRGLAGGFNANVCRASHRFVDERVKTSAADEVRLAVVGRKGREYFRPRRLRIGHELPGVSGETATDRPAHTGMPVTAEFTEGRSDGVFVAYNEFRSAVSQRATIARLLPITPAPLPPDAGHTDFLYEPGKGELLDLLLPLYVQSQIYRAMLESIASEFGAKMTAMENATRNATEMIDRLTLQYNRARQAAITKELMEIVGGAEALKG